VVYDHLFHGGSFFFLLSLLFLACSDDRIEWDILSRCQTNDPEPETPSPGRQEIPSRSTEETTTPPFFSFYVKHNLCSSSSKLTFLLTQIFFYPSPFISPLLSLFISRSSFRGTHILQSRRVSVFLILSFLLNASLTVLAFLVWILFRAHSGVTFISCCLLRPPSFASPFFLSRLSNLVPPPTFFPTKLGPLIERIN